MDIVTVTVTSLSGIVKEYVLSPLSVTVISPVTVTEFTTCVVAGVTAIVTVEP